MSPRTKEAQEKVREASRNNILNSALKLFAEKGYHATSMDNLARSAGISKGLIYNYFPTKEALLKGVVESAMDFSNEVTMPNPESPDIRIEFQEFLESFFILIKTRTDTLRLILSLSIQIHTFDFIQNIAKAKSDFYDDFFEHCLQALGFQGTKEEVYELECILEGAATIYYVMGDDEKLDKVKLQLIKKYCS